MQTLPNGIKIFNATPHVIRFWREDWDEPVEVGPDKVVSAKIVDGESASTMFHPLRDKVEFVTPQFQGTDEGNEVIGRATAAGADLVVGSIIAAQAYPGEVVAMTPAPGYERVAPAEKRMNPDKFTVY